MIIEAEAKIIGRIFEEYVAGRTPRDIACDLNKDGVPPPRGRTWNASTINGNEAYSIRRRAAPTSNTSGPTFESVIVCRVLALPLRATTMTRQFH